VAKAFKLNTRIVYVKSAKDYEESPDPGECLVFKEEEREPVDVEETIADDVRLLHRLFVNRFNAAM
jgi:hypothetical protein